MKRLELIIHESKKALAENGWELSKKELEKRAAKLAEKYPDITNAQAVYLANKAAYRWALDLERNQVTVSRWEAAARIAKKEELNYQKKKKNAMKKIGVILSEEEMPIHERITVLLTIRGKTDAFLQELYPESNRAQRDQWRCRGRKRIVKRAPFLKPWLRLRKGERSFRPVAPSNGIALRKPTGSYSELSKAKTITNTNRT